jgi:hypothetical protein
VVTTRHGRADRPRSADLSARMGGVDGEEDARHKTTRRKTTRHKTQEKKADARCGIPIHRALVTLHRGAWSAGLSCPHPSKWDCRYQWAALEHPWEVRLTRDGKALAESEVAPLIDDIIEIMRILTSIMKSSGA